MAIESKQAALCIKKVFRSSIRKAYRFVSEHPILFSLGVLLNLLYRSAPGFFAFLVSSSPVIICTTLLLGVLLSYGESNLPEAADYRMGTPEISAFKVGNSSSDIHFEANQRLSAPEFREDTSNFKERDTKQTILVRDRASEHVDLDDDVPLLSRVEDERPDRRNIPRTLTPFPSMVNLRQEVGIGEDLSLRKERESEDPFFIQDTADSPDGQTTLFDGALLSDLNAKDTSFGSFSSSENVNKHVDMEQNLNQERVFPDSAANKEREISEEKQHEGFAGTSKPSFTNSVQEWKMNDGLNIDTRNVVEGNLLDSSLGSPWARVSSQDGSSGFDSDGAESSSPDASMADIAPVLDEIDPLLGADSSCAGPIPKDDSDSDSHVSEDHQIDDDSNDEGDENDAKDNVEGKKKDEGTEAAFLWTADDEKNLIDLGYSEMERNRRLEILMARRRSRKNIRFEIDNNLIDTDINGADRNSDDFSCFRAQVPHISVPRQNPFDLPYDSKEAAIPGSAPSILHGRKNPFDLPLEPYKDSGDHAHDSLNSGESVMSSHRDMFFRRHESFNFGITDSTQERRSSRLKPYFVPETVEWSASNFQRQFSDKSETVLRQDSDLAYVGSEEKDLHMEHDSRGLLRQDSDLAYVGSECSDSINSVDVELDNSDIDDREIALQHFVFERSQEREASLASTKGKGREEDYTLNPAGNSTSFHPVADLLSWEDVDGDISLGAKPSFEPNTEVECSEWVSSSRPAEEVESGSGDLPLHPDTEVASSSNTVVLGAGSLAGMDGNVDLMSYSNHEISLDNLIHGSVELPSEFVKETLPVISRDLHPIPEERVVENFNMQEKHETTVFTDLATSLTGLHVIEEHFDVGSDGSLSFGIVSPYPHANDVIQSPSSEPVEVSNHFVSEASKPNKVDIGELKEEPATEYLLDSDDEAGKVYPEPMEGSGVDENFLSELDAVGDFRVEPMGLEQQVPDRTSHSDSPANGNGVASDSLISPQTSDNLSSTMSETSARDSREQSPLLDDLHSPEFRWSFGASHGDPEQTVYNPRKRILEGNALEPWDTELKPSHEGTQIPSSITPSAAILVAGSSKPEVTKNESMITTADPEITILDAKSLDDTGTAFKLVGECVVAETSTDTKTSHAFAVCVDSEPEEVAGQLYVVDAKSVDDINAAFEEHRDSIVDRSLEENEEAKSVDVHGENAESKRHDIPELIHAEISHNVEHGREAEPVEDTSSTSSSEVVRHTHEDVEAVYDNLTDGSAKSSVQAIESDDACERKEESEQQ